MQKSLVLPVAVAICVPLSVAQTASPSPDASWSRVEQIQPKTILHLRTMQGRKLKCAFVSADETTLTCIQGAAIPIPRAEIRSIAVPHRVRSAAIGFGIGAGAGAVIGAGIGQNGQIIGRGGLAAIFAVPLALIGGAIGAATDFSHGTLYKAP